MQLQWSQLERDQYKGAIILILWFFSFLLLLSQTFVLIYTAITLFTDQILKDLEGYVFIPACQSIHKVGYWGLT